MASKIEIREELLAELTRLADEEGTPLTQYVESTIKWALSNRVALDPLFSNYKPYDGPTPTDLSASHDDYLYGDSP